MEYIIWFEFSTLFITRWYKFIENHEHQKLLKGKRHQNLQVHFTNPNIPCWNVNRK